MTANRSLHSPIPLYCCGAALMLFVQGVYRISGVQSKIQALLVNTLEKGRPWNHDDEDEFTIAGAVKLAFKSLIEPLFTFALYDEFVEAASAYQSLMMLVQHTRRAEMRDEAEKMLKLRGALAQLPTAHFQAAEVLFSHLRRYVHACRCMHSTYPVAYTGCNTAVWSLIACSVALLKDVNKMSAGNLGVVFGPTVMRPEVESASSIQNLNLQNRLG